MNEIGEIIFSLILLGWAANTVYFVVGWARGEIVFRPKNTETIEKEEWYCDIEFHGIKANGQKVAFGIYNMTLSETYRLMRRVSRGYNRSLFWAIADSDPNLYHPIIEEMHKKE